MSEYCYVFAEDTNNNTLIHTVRTSDGSITATHDVIFNFLLGNPLKNTTVYYSKMLGATILNNVLYASVDITNSLNSDHIYSILWTDNFTLGSDITFSNKIDTTTDGTNNIAIYGLAGISDGNNYVLYGINGTNTASNPFTVYSINVSPPSGTYNLSFASNVLSPPFSPITLVHVSSSPTLYSYYNDGSSDYFRVTDKPGDIPLNNGLTVPIISVAIDLLNISDVYYYNENSRLVRISQNVDRSYSTTQLNVLTYNNGANTYTYPVLFFGPTACIHNSSKILMANGSYKLVTDVTSGDELFSPDCKTTTVKEVVPCWLNVPNNPYHKCIVFEKDSLAPNMPNERFIIDPTHPMSTLKDYENNGLVVAKDFVNGKTIYKTDYKEVQEMFPENMKHNRYDIVLTKGDTYVANNVVVKSRVSINNAGYDLSIE